MSVATRARGVDTRDLLYGALLGNTLAALAVAYLLFAGITVTQPRYALYGLLWVFVGVLVFWKTDPAPTDERTRRRALAIAGLYVVVLAVAGGVVVTAMRPGAGEFGVRLATSRPVGAPRPCSRRRGRRSC